ncbi:hypothetical protein EAF04_002888 [Stromatinia cepivora]|nr:hypothetical protein EAF04_002888 [Stromatinia cepivora]
MIPQVHQVASYSVVVPTTEQNRSNPLASYHAHLKFNWSRSLPFSTLLLSVGSFLKTLYLFPSNDIQTMIIPVTIIGLLGALTDSYSTIPSPVLPDTGILITHLISIPRTFLWVYLNVLLFAISNQRSPKSVLEDSINKSWRPIPSGRITSSSARRLLFILIPIDLFVSHYFLGACQETVLCLLLTWMYNDLGGSDEHFIVRNAINSLAYFVYGSGALRVAAGTSTPISADASIWLGIISAIVFSTMQVQDLKDQVGDRVTNRDTLPLSIGDTLCRYTIVFGVLTWSLATPRYWSIDLFTRGSVLPVILGLFVTYRVLLHRSPEADIQTYKAWSAWLMSVCFLPLLRYLPSFHFPVKGGQLFKSLQTWPKLHASIIMSGTIAYVILVRILRHRRSIQRIRLFISATNFPCH